MSSRAPVYAERQLVELALKRLRMTWNRKEQAQQANLQKSGRRIRLGLERVRHAVDRHQKQRWIGIHVGGTNGKGSICAYLAGLFKMHGVSFGTFTSPALPEDHNAITIQDRYISKAQNEVALDHADRAYQKWLLRFKFHTDLEYGDLTPFERETAAAFRILNFEQVQYGIVEVGMGGLTDATNVMKHKAITVISKIGLDHQEYLGNTLEQIASIKAGIMRPRVPCVVDHTNQDDVIDVLRQQATRIGARLILSNEDLPALSAIDTQKYQLEEYQRQNLACAVTAFSHLFPQVEIDINKFLATDPFPSGRTEPVRIEGLTNGSRQQPIIVDGAHNKLGMETLARYVDTRLRTGEEPITWVMGMSESPHKSFGDLLGAIVRPQDNVAIVEYAPQPNSPPPAFADVGRDYVREILTTQAQAFDGDADVTSALQWASDVAAGGHVVLTGSLYLIRELYNLPGVEPSRRKETRSEVRLERLERESDKTLTRLKEMTETGELETPEVEAVETGRRASPTEESDVTLEDSHESRTSSALRSSFRQKPVELYQSQVSEVNSQIKDLSQRIQKSLEAGATKTGPEITTLLKEYRALDALRTQTQASYVRAKVWASSERLPPDHDEMSDSELYAWWVALRKRQQMDNLFVKYEGAGLRQRVSEEQRTATTPATESEEQSDTTTPATAPPQIEETETRRGRFADAADSEEPQTTVNLEEQMKKGRRPD